MEGKKIQNPEKLVSFHVFFSRARGGMNSMFVNKFKKRKQKQKQQQN